MEFILRRFGVFLISVILVISFFKINGYFDNKKSSIIRSDGWGYYSYLPALFIYGDFSQGFVKENAEKYYTAVGVPEYMQKIGGKAVDKYFVGTAVLMYPFFITAHWVALYTGQPADGYSMLYQYFAGLAAIFYVFIGLYFCNRLLKKYNATTNQAFFIVAMIAFATNLFYYTVIEPTMSHAFSFSMISAFLYYAKDIFQNRRKESIIPAFIALGFVVLLRPYNGIVILALPFLAGSFKELVEGLKTIFRNYFSLLKGLLLFFIIISIQLVVWYIQTGHFLVYSYTYEKFYFDKPHLEQLLFSYRKGFFVYTPICFLALAGLIKLFQKRKFAAVSLFLFLIILFYTMSSWYMWYYGASFGMRPMVEYYGLFALLLLFVLKLLKRPFAVYGFAVLCLLLLVVNQVQAYQYRSFILHWELMSRYKYWKVFMKPGDEWKGYLWNNPEPSDIAGYQVSKFDFDFEKETSHDSTIIDAGTKAHSGSRVVYTFEKNFSDSVITIRQGSGLSTCVKPAMYVYGYINSNNAESGNAWFIISFSKPDGSVYYTHARPLDNFFYDKNNWKRFEIALKTDKLQSDSDIIKIGFKSSWNEALIDDVSLRFIDGW